jgi:MFS family permease
MIISPILLAGFFYFYEYMLRTYPSVYRDQIQQYYDFSSLSGFGFFGSSYYYLYVPLQLFVGIIADRINTRNLLMFSAGGCSIGLLTLLYPDEYTAFIGRMLIGTASSCGYVLIFKSVAMYAPQKRIGFYTGLGVCFGYFGALLTAPVMSWFQYIHMSWNDVNLFFICFGFSLLIIIFLCFKSTTPVRSFVNTNQQQDSIAFLCKNFVKQLKNKKLILIGLVSFAAFTPTVIFNDLWGVSYLKHVQHLSSIESSFVIAASFFGWLVGSLTMGWIADKFSAKYIMLSGLSIALLSVCTILYVSLPFEMILLLALINGVTNSVQVLCLSLTVKITEAKYVGSATSLINFMTMFSGIIFQGLVGTLVTSFHSYKLAFMVMPIAICTSIILAIILFIFLKNDDRITIRRG